MSDLTFTPVIPVGEIILITGVNGYIGAQVAEKLLSAGYRVRGSVRNLEKSKPLQEQFDKKHGAGRFELVKVENINEEGAFDEAAKDISGIAHIAVDTNMSGEPEPYIQNTINGTINILRTAKAEPKIKRFVLTASSIGAVPWKTDVEYNFGTDSYNEESIKQAYQPPFTPDKAFTVYAAAKALTEKAVSRWLAQERPHFTYNAIIPAANFGVSASGPFGSTGGMVKSAAEGDFSMIQYILPQFFVDVNDNALLHVGALIHPDVQNERLFAFAEPYNWNTVLAILRKLYPQRVFPEDLPALGKDLSHPPNGRAEFVLKSLGAPGWKSLEQSLKEAFDTIYD